MELKDIVSQVVQLHDLVDARTEPLNVLHRDRLRCGKGCHDCCVDQLTVFEVEAERIKAGGGQVLSTAPHPEGKCAFLDGEGACRIYEHRPYVCRTQGLPLRWLEEDGEELLEYRDICPLNDEEGFLEVLEEDACWSLGDIEGQLATLQAAFRPGELKRVALRDLFQAGK